MASASPTLERPNDQLVSSMPTGWSLEANSDSGVGCLHNLLEPAGIKQTSVAEVYFVHSGGLPFLDEKLATYSNAKKAFKRIAQHHRGVPQPVGSL
jgi:hypothetical protein